MIYNNAFLLYQENFIEEANTQIQLFWGLSGLPFWANLASVSSKRGNGMSSNFRDENYLATSSTKSWVSYQHRSLNHILFIYELIISELYIIVLDLWKHISDNLKSIE